MSAWTAATAVEAGPTMDGRLGVTVAAPGDSVFTTYNPTSWWATFRYNLIAGGNGLYGRASAVSAANPIVTGIVALMLEADPTLDAIEVRDILQSTARADAFTGAVPNTRWGYGKVDAFAAVQEVVRRRGGAVAFPPRSFSAGVNGNTVLLSWVAPEGGPPVFGYVLEAGAVPGAANLASMPVSGTSITVSAPNGVYYARVRANTSSGRSDPSNEVRIVVPSGGPTPAPPTAPTLSPAALANRTVTLSWTSTAATAIVLARLEPSSPVIASLPVVGNSVSVPNVPTGTYYVSVVATAGGATSGESNQIVVTVP